MKRVIGTLAAIQLLSAIGSIASVQSASAAGAVVESPDKRIAYWTTHKASQDIAAAIAMGNCGSRFGSCWLKTTFENGCLAVAVAHTPGGTHWAWSVRPNPQAAQAAAMARCAADGDDCSLKTSSCE